MTNFDTVTNRFSPSVGQIVGVCYDSKWGRIQKGTVTKVTRRWFTVSFLPWANEEAGLVEIKIIRRKSKRRCYGGWVCGRGEGGVMAMLGCRGDWYSVLPSELLRSEGYWPY